MFWRCTKYIANASRNENTTGFHNANTNADSNENTTSFHNANTNADSNENTTSFYLEACLER